MLVLGRKAMAFISFLEKIQNHYGLLHANKLEKLISTVGVLKIFLYSVMLRKTLVLLFNLTMDFS